MMKKCLLRKESAMIKTCCNRVTAWVMMGLLVVGLNVWFALPAMAAPINYGIGGGTASGGFTLDDTLLEPYTNWQISFGGQVFDKLTDVVTLINIFDGTSFSLTTFNGVEPLVFNATFTSSDSGSYFVTLATGCCGEETGGFGAVGNPVPEPNLGMLLMIGLLVLAGARWLARRREGLQRG